jgi:5-dehydro-2-deoxygluconokinase
MPTELELLTVGRISVDLYASEPGKGWDDVGGFVKAVGGSATNVAVAASRLGHRCAVLTKVGEDPFGTFLRRRLADFGVDTRFVGTSKTLRTPLAFAVLEHPDDPELLFYREPLAPDLTIELSDLDAGVLEAVEVFWVTGTGMSAEPSASTTRQMLARRKRRAHTVVDLDYRPTFWSSPAAARQAIASIVEYATVAVGNRGEFEIAVGTADPSQAASRLLDAGVEWVVVKMGGDGVLVATPHQQAVVPALGVEVLCGLGAGDAFGGALVHGLLEGWDPLRAVTFANAAGALVASRLLCADAMGSESEINALLEGSASAIR